MSSYLFSFRGARDSMLLPETFDAWVAIAVGADA